jgi:hypothetical protein
MLNDLQHRSLHSIAAGPDSAQTPHSLQQVKHPTKPGRVTNAGHPSDDLAPGTQNSILKQAGLKG